MRNMSKFCGNCGATLEDSATACTNCGMAIGNSTPVQSSPLSQSPKKKASKKIAIILCLTAAVALIAWGASFAMRYIGYRAVITNTVNAICDCDADRLSSLFYEPSVDAIWKSDGLDDDSLRYAMNNLEDNLGDDCKIKYKVNYTKKISVKDTKGFSEWLAYSYKDERFIDNDISQFLLVDTTFIAKGKDRAETISLDVLLAKEDGNWKIFYFNKTDLISYLEAYKDFDPDEYEEDYE